MTLAISKALNNLGVPKVIIEDSFETKLQENIVLMKSILGSDWYPLESDPYMKKLRVLTLRQMHNQADKNNTVLSLLATTATGTDLDSIGIDRNVIRDEGEAPYADFKFNLTKLSDGKILIPKNTRIGNLDNLDIYSTTLKDVYVTLNQPSVTVQAQLSYNALASDITFNSLITDIPYIGVIQQLTSFSNGTTTEDDERYRLRIILNKNRFNTAGSEDAYTFFTYSADSRIDDVFVTSEKALDVNVYISSSEEVDEVMIGRVNEVLSKKSIRPLNDRVIVKPAKIIPVDISATIEVFKIENSSKIKTLIESNFFNTFFIGQDFVKSDLDRKTHIDGVYRVVSDFQDMIINDNEVLKINSLNLDFKEVA
jgi:phage-related baseplate assembly protein